MAVNIDAAAQVMENHANSLDGEAAQFENAAAQLMATARQAAEQVMAEAKAGADKILADAQTSADNENGNAQDKRDEATYWRELAASERSKGRIDPAGDTTPDGQQPGEGTGALPAPGASPPKPWTPEPKRNQEASR